MYSLVSGEIRNSQIVTPKDSAKKPYQKIQLLQSLNGQDDKLVDVRDYDLNRKYNGKFNAPCVTNAYGGYMLTICLREVPKS